MSVPPMYKVKSVLVMSLTMLLMGPNGSSVIKYHSEYGSGVAKM